MRICDWSWDEQKKILKIRQGPRGDKQISVSSVNLEKLESPDLGNDCQRLLLKQHPGAADTIYRLLHAWCAELAHEALTGARELWSVGDSN